MVLGIAFTGAVPSAQASNAVTPRTPPIFKREACLSVVDRSVDPIFHLDFGIPYEDAMLTPDELSDSRRFQFFAVCRDHHLAESLPNWVRMDDAERSLEAEIISELPEVADVLESAPGWSSGHDGQPGSCAVAVNAADERMAITCEATEGALDWDTSDVPPGNYVIHGYTFEPELNFWEARRGVVQVVDAADERFPVVSIMFPARDGARAYEHDGYRVVGCMDGPPGTTVRLSWAAASGLEPGVAEGGTWTEIAELDAAEQAFDVVFDIPPEAVQQAVVLRGIAEDPQGRQWVGYAPHPLIVYPGDGESDPPFKPAGPDYCGFYPDDEGDTTGGPDTGEDDGASTGVSTATSATTSTGAESTDIDDRGGGGCACRTARNPRDAWLHAIWLVALGAARRRR